MLKIFARAAFEMVIFCQFMEVLDSFEAEEAIEQFSLECQK